MKVQLESTDKIVELRFGEGGPVTQARLWQGITEGGVLVHAYIARIGVASDSPPNVLAVFEKELAHQAKPRAEFSAIPLRLII